MRTQKEKSHFNYKKVKDTKTSEITKTRQKTTNVEHTKQNDKKTNAHKKKDTQQTVADGPFFLNCLVNSSQFTNAAIY